MPGDVTTSVTAVVSVVDKATPQIEQITKALDGVAQAQKQIMETAAGAYPELAKFARETMAPGARIHGEDVVPEIAAPVAVEAGKVVGVYERMRDQLGEIGAGIKERLGGAFEHVFAVARRVGSGITAVFSSFGGQLAAGFGIGTVIDLAVSGINDLAKAAGTLRTQAATIGDTVSHLQDLREWAREGNAPIDRVVSSLANLARVTAGVAEGAKGYDRAAAAFAALHVALQDADTGQIRKVTDLLPDLARAFQNIQDPAERAKQAFDIFGQTWKLMLPLLMQGPEALANAQATADAIGKITDAQIDAAVKYDDALKTLQASWEATRETIGAAVLPAVTPALVELTKFVQTNREGIGAGFKTGVEGLIEVFKQLDAVVQSTNADIQAIKGLWNWATTAPPGWASQTTPPPVPPVAWEHRAGGPLTPEDLARTSGAGSAPTGTVDVRVDITGAPPGTRTTAQTTGQGITADVGQSMPWSTPEYRGPWAPATP
jgi:hypothetical protein